MAKNHAGGDRRRPLIVGQVGPRDVLAQRPVQLEHARVDQGHHTGREDRLAQGSRCEHGGVVDRPATVAASARGHDPRHAIAIHDPDRGARDAVFIQEFSNHRPETHGSILH